VDVSLHPAQHVMLPYLFLAVTCPLQSLEALGPHICVNSSLGRCAGLDGQCCGSSNSQRQVLMQLVTRPRDPRPSAGQHSIGCALPLHPCACISVDGLPVSTCFQCPSRKFLVLSVPCVVGWEEV
jgi:hypothetical protein